MSKIVPATKHQLRTLTEGEITSALEAMRRAAEVRERMLVRRGGKPLPSSWRTIRRERERRPSMPAWR